MRRIDEADLARDWDSETRRMDETGEPLLITREGAGSVVFLPAQVYSQLVGLAGGTSGAFWAAIARAPGRPE